MSEGGFVRTYLKPVDAPLIGACLLAVFLAITFSLVGEYSRENKCPNESSADQHQADDNTAAPSPESLQEKPKDGDANAQSCESEKGFGYFLVSKFRIFARLMRRYSEFVTAAFTVVLAVATIRLMQSTKALWVAGEKQAGLLRESIAVAEKAADAAVLNANAAIGMERPVLQIEKIWCTVLPPTSEDEIENWCKRFSPAIKIKNHGRTPAFIKSIIINGIIGKVPWRPTYQDIKKSHELLVLAANTDMEYVELSFWADRQFTREQLISLTKREETLSIYGVVSFTDFLGAEHKRGFVGRWDDTTTDCWLWGSVFTNYDYQS